MRRAWVIFVALALAACNVDVEGAKCSTPGSTAECPDGQACGADNKCSTRAGGCVAACAQQGLLCRTSDYTCMTCPTNPVPQFAVDLAGSLASAPVVPTGLAQPTACRFKRLGDALAAAGGASAVVRVYGNAGETFGKSTGETFPLTIPAGVTLDGTGVQGVVIQGDAASAASVLTVQGTVKGVAVANLSMTGNGIDMTCGATGSPALTDVTVSAPAAKAFVNAITVSGACGAVLQRVDASGASGPALNIAADIPAAPITVKGSRLHGSGTGIKATGGTLLFQADGATSTEVSNNTGVGILITGATPAVDLTLDSVVVAGNGSTGVFIDNVAQQSKLTMKSCDVHSNAATSSIFYGPASDRRKAGGVLVSSPVLLAGFQMQAINVYANDGKVGADEMAFESSAGPWPLRTPTTTACPPVPNAFGCPGAGRAVSVTSPGTVDAQFTNWPVTPPPAVPGVDETNYCGTWSGTCP